MLKTYFTLPYLYLVYPLPSEELSIGVQKHLFVIERGVLKELDSTCIYTKTRDLKITHPVRLRRFRLKFNGIGRRGFNQQKKGRQD